jgi:hypothetical protein
MCIVLIGSIRKLQKKRICDMSVPNTLSADIKIEAFMCLLEDLVRQELLNNTL